MGRRRRQDQHLWLIRADAHRTTPHELETRRAAFSILVEGLQPYAFLRAMWWNDCVTKGSQNRLFEEIMRIGDMIISMARESMAKAYSEIEPGTVISFDGSWDHRRRGSNCILAVFSCTTHKIIECALVSNKVGRRSENYCESPTMMEAKALSMVIPKLIQDPRIAGYVHDHDAKASKMIEDAGWNIKGYLDPGHCMKAFKKRLTKFEQENKGILKGIEGPLTRWMATLMKYDGPVEEKLSHWRNSVKHYMGDHSHCIHGRVPVHYWDRAGDVEAVAALKKFIASTEFILESSSTEFDTQSNESFHRTKLKYATKDVKWGRSWTSRMMCAVLDRNWPYWKLTLYERLGLPKLSTECERLLRNYEDERLARKLFIHSDEHRAKKMRERLAIPRPVAHNRHEILLYEYELPPERE